MKKIQDLTYSVVSAVLKIETSWENGTNDCLSVSNISAAPKPLLHEEHLSETSVEFCVWTVSQRFIDAETSAVVLSVRVKVEECNCWVGFHAAAVAGDEMVNGACLPSAAGVCSISESRPKSSNSLTVCWLLQISVHSARLTCDPAPNVFLRLCVCVYMYETEGGGLSEWWMLWDQKGGRGQTGTTQTARVQTQIHKET